TLAAPDHVWPGRHLSDSLYLSSTAPPVLRFRVRRLPARRRREHPVSPARPVPGWHLVLARVPRPVQRPARLRSPPVPPEPPLRTLPASAVAQQRDRAA